MAKKVSVIMEDKIFAAILAGGIGTRMGNSNKPKQYFMLGDKPVLAHTLEKFALLPKFERIFILTPDIWKNQTLDIIEKYCPEFADRVEVLNGGETRNDTIQNACKHILENYENAENAIIVTHDAVRPFVTYRMIVQNIQAVIDFGACDTTVPASDTIVQSNDGKCISDIPLRDKLYQGQTPQSFRVGELSETLSSLNEEEGAICTDACKAYILRNKEVALVDGDVSNIKITYPADMLIARALLNKIES